MKSEKQNFNRNTSGVVIIRARAYAPVYMCRSVVRKAGDLRRVDFNAVQEGPKDLLLHTSF